MTNAETIKKIKLVLQRGDQPEIAKKTGLSLAWVNQIINGKRGTYTHKTQKAVINASLEVIKARRNRTSSNEIDNSEKIKALLG